MDECPTYFDYNLKLLNFDILFSKLPNCFGHFNKLLGEDMPKLLHMELWYIFHRDCNPRYVMTLNSLYDFNI